jgi:hypothetical protein
VVKLPIPDRALIFVNSCSPILLPSKRAQRRGQQLMSNQGAAANAEPRELEVCDILSVDGTSIAVPVLACGCGRMHAHVHILPIERRYKRRSGTTCVPYFHTAKPYRLERRAQRRKGIGRVLLHWNVSFCR